jgi:antirestriction protein
MLTGNDLLNRVNELQAQEPPAKMSDIVRECGYIKEDGKLAYTDFYTELLTVKGILNNNTPENEISEEYQEKYSELCDSYGVDAVDAFLELYDEDDLESFEEAYYGSYDSEADFAEQFVNDTCDFDIPSFVVVDWEATWNCNLRYDFDFEDGFVFNKNW